MLRMCFHWDKCYCLGILHEYNNANWRFRAQKTPTPKKTISTDLMCPKPSSGRYGSFLTWMMESYSEGCRPWATMLARITATIMGRMWEIWPVSSKQITAVDTVCVTAPVKAAAPIRRMWNGRRRVVGWTKWEEQEGKDTRDRGGKSYNLRMEKGIDKEWQGLNVQHVS